MDLLIDRLEWCGLLDQLFGLSFWRHPFTAEGPLVSMWCNMMLNFSKSVPIKKHKYILDDLSCEYSAFSGELFF